MSNNVAIRENVRYPDADISIKKNRIKKYGSNIYLKDGTEFEIELTNHSTKKWLAKILVNGSYISDAGFILKPGEHQYLERFLNNSKRFLFSTYDVEDTDAVKHAIRNNGVVTVEFYDEIEYFPNWLTTTTTWTTTNPYLYSNPFVYDGISAGNYFVGSGSSTGGDARMLLTDSTTAFTNSNVTLTSNGNVGLGAANPRDQLRVSKQKKSVETGRVDKGSESKQEFVTEFGTFNAWRSHFVEYHLLPVSQKPNEKKDLVVYCTGCGVKTRKGWKYCASCGTKIM